MDQSKIIDTFDTYQEQKIEEKEREWEICQESSPWEGELPPFVLDIHPNQYQIRQAVRRAFISGWPEPW